LDWTVQGLEEARRIVLDWKKLVATIDPKNITVEPSTDLEAALLDDLNTPEAIFALHKSAKLASNNPGARNALYADLVFLGILGDALVEAKQTELELSEVPIPTDTRSMEAYRSDIVHKLDVKLYSFNPGVSATTVITSVMSNAKFSFLEGSLSRWQNYKKYNPSFISSSDARYIDEKVGIDKLNYLIEQRLVARKAKNFAESDRIRDELLAMGVMLKDSKDGTTWELTR
jgi:cysteinyl-tRNA synthetase